MKLVTCGFLLYSSAGGSDSRCCLIQEWPKSDADVFFSLHNSSALLSNCSCTEIIIFMSMRYTFTVLWKRILCCMHPVRSWVSMNPKACGMIHPINLEKKKDSNFMLWRVQNLLSQRRHHLMLPSLIFQIPVAVVGSCLCTCCVNPLTAHDRKSCVTYCRRQECVQKIMLMD